MNVPSGANLQAAIDAALPGDTLTLEAGAVFVGNFNLSYGLTLVSSVPPPRGRIDPATTLPVLRSLNALPALHVRGGVGHRFTGIRFEGSSTGDIVQLGDGLATDVNLLPSDIVFDRCVIRAEPTSKRGLQMNSRATTVTRCHISGVKLSGQETQAIACWNGPGPFTVEDNYIEAGSIGILFGGAQPSIPDLVPSDILVRWNTVTRPIEMRNGAWAVKNLFELKNARRVTVVGNVFEHNWPQAQDGYAILFTVRAQGPSAPWSTVEDVTFEHNILRHVSGAFNILGRDDQYPSGVASNILIRNNLCHHIDRFVWGGGGAFLKIGGGPEAVLIRDNTILQTGNIISAYGSLPTLLFAFASNVAQHNTYGIFGDAVGTGNPAIARYFPGSAIIGNLFGGGTASQYPASNTFVSALPVVQDYHFPPGAGCDISLLESHQTPPLPPTPFEIVYQVTAAALQGCDTVGGDVSPQEAARRAVIEVRDTVLSRMTEVV